MNTEAQIYLDAITAKVSGLEGWMLKDIATDCYNDCEDSNKGVILDAALTELENRMDSKNFVEFCEILEAF